MYQYQVHALLPNSRLGLRMLNWVATTVLVCG